MKKNKKRNTIMLLILLVCGITIGFAVLTTTLQINGVGLVKGNKWDIHWENVDNESGVQAETPQIDAAKTTVTYEINLVNPGDYYEFTVDAVNKGSIDGEINKIETRFYAADGDSEIELPSYLKYSVTYDDDSPLEIGQRLNVNQTKTYKVRIDFKTNVTAEELPEVNTSIVSKFTVVYIQPGIKIETKSFEEDSWPTIVDAIRTGKTEDYNVGDEKDIDLGEYGIHRVRIANKSTPSECDQPGFSQTACGFVLEFVDSITPRIMAPYDSRYYYGDDTANIPNGVGNRGSWQYCDARAFLNNGVYQYQNIDYSTDGLFDNFPKVIRDAIIPTTVVTGHGWYSTSTFGDKGDNTNFTTTDKIYLLAPHEIYEDVSEEGRLLYRDRDTDYYNTRQLDYYRKMGTTSENYASAIKQSNGVNREWWLRTPFNMSPYVYYNVSDSGFVDYNYAYTSSSPNGANPYIGISPAFRLG